MPRRIAVVHHPNSFFALDLRRAIGLDLEPIWVLAGGVDPALTRLLTRTGPVVEAEGLDASEIAERLGRLRPSGVVTFVDDTIPLTAAIADRCGLAYHSEEVAATVVNKRQQRAAFAAAGVPGARFRAVPAGADLATLQTIAGEIGYPSVLKPALGSGSLGLRLLSCPEDLRDVVLSAPAVVEEYLPDATDIDAHFASYLSVESIVSHGRVSHAAICGRFPLAAPFRETGNFIPGPVAPGPETAALLDVADAAIRALGISSSIVHTEIKLTDAGPRVIEVNGRLGGRPPFVLCDVSDVNLFRAACDVAMGEHVVMDGLAQTRGVGFYWMAQPPRDARSVLATRGLDAIAAAPGINSVALDRRPGERVDWREGTGGRVVTVRGRVPDLDALTRTIDFVQDTLEIEYETSPQLAGGELVAAAR